MAGPMVTLVPGNRRCTASAITCAVEWRMTASPSGSAARTGVSSAAVASIGVCRSTVRPRWRTAMTSLSMGPAAPRISRGVLRSDMGKGEPYSAGRPGPKRGGRSRAGHLHPATPFLALSRANGAMRLTGDRPVPTDRCLMRLASLAFGVFAMFSFFGLSVTACHKADEASSSGPGQAAAPLHVQTAAVSEQPMPEYLTLTGSLHASQQSDIAADASGKVLQVLVERGQAVKAGQVIATLDARSANLSATAAQAQSHLAQSQLEQAQRDCERVKHLLDTGAISRAEFDRQTSQCTAQQWSAAAAEAQQQSATKLVGDARIRAPFDGIIGERLVNVGQYVDRNTRVASIYQPDPLRLELTIPEASLASIHEGVEVVFSVAAFGDEHLDRKST